MKLPNADRAAVDIAKLRNYSLSPTHSKGRFKARVFLAALGLTSTDAAVLRGWLLHAALHSEATLGMADGFGARYIVDFAANHHQRIARVRSVWIVRTQEDFPRLVTCYLL